MCVFAKALAAVAVTVTLSSTPTFSSHALEVAAVQQFVNADLGKNLRRIDEALSKTSRPRAARK